MTRPPSVVPHVRYALCLLMLLAVLAGCVAPGQSSISPFLPHLDVDAYLRETYDVDAEQLRMDAREWSETLLASSADADIEKIARACRPSILYTPEFYAHLYDIYTSPIFWTVELNFAETQEGDSTVEGNLGKPFVACLRLYWRYNGTFAASTRVKPDGNTLERGVPLLCYQLGGGAVQTNEPSPTALSSTIAARSAPLSAPLPLTSTAPFILSTSPEYWTADFPGDVFLWCPIDLAAGLRAYLYGAHDADAENPPALSEPFLQELALLTPTGNLADALFFADAFAKHVAQVSRDEFEDYPNFISLAAARNLPRTPGVHPIMDYLTACSNSERCGFGFRQSIEVSTVSTTTFTMTGGFTENGPMPSASPRTTVPPLADGDAVMGFSPRAAPFLYQTCPDFKFPDDPADRTMLMADGGAIATTLGLPTLPGDLPAAGRATRNQVAMAGRDPQECYKLNTLPQEGSDWVRFWMGESSLFVGHRPGDGNAIYAGSLDFLWFDPNQTVPPG